MKLPLLLIAIVLLLTGVAYAALNTVENTQVPELLPTTSYKNEDYGYSLSYPADLEVREYADGNAVFGHVDGEMMQGVAEVRVLNIEGETGETSLDAIARSLATLCAADGPSASISCTRIESSEPITTASGTPGTLLYLSGEMRTIPDGATTTIRKGPYMAFVAGTSATNTRVIVIHAPLNQTADEADTDTIRTIANSLVLTQHENLSVNTYIAEHLEELSSVKTILGGTFSITHIETQETTGTVAYEDGHNAYTADFVYAVDMDGAVSVSDFRVRP